ncbi:MAG: DNA polymerase III subunit alpha [Patescibacteria group bacterium]|nr:DNA polymerase III subunit alpha [Patescibacteria group bacterium]
MYIPLHNHSHYSLLDGLPKLEDYLKKCLEYKIPAMALTDHGAMYGALEFYQLAKKMGVKPIIGMEAYVAPRRLIYKKTKLDEKAAHLILLAKNNVGYHNLIELATIAQLDGFYYKPRLDKEVLKKYAEGLIGSSACWAGEINRALREDNLELAEKLTREYQEIFGAENFYLEMVYLGENIKGQEEYFEKIAALSIKTGAPLIATKDSHYINKVDAEAQDVMLAINTGSTVDTPGRLSMLEFDCSFASPEVMEEKFKKYPGAIENTAKIADQCEVKLELGKWNFPAIELPENKTAEEVLRENARDGLSKKIPNTPQNYLERLEYELEIIIKKGYAPYFLVVADLINWSRENGIVMTTRGSAAGSLVSFAIGIITIDPIAFKLPFERFLNPFRPSPPDIDMDFADNRRDEMIEYATKKYGADKVAQICTFGTMMARGSVRDVTRALGIPYEYGDKLAKMIPFGSQGFAMTIEAAMGINPELKMEYENNPDAKRIIELAQKIEGCCRHTSIHAAGVLIAPRKITEFVPLQRDPSGRKKITQYEMGAAEAAGLLKFDFLGITNLSIMGEAIKLIKKTKGVEIDLAKVPFDDKKTYELLAKGETIGVFQLSSSGMTKYLIDLKPTNIFDIMAMVALYRPGPMESIPEFIRRKHNPTLVTYPDPRMKDVLDMSLGLLIYQEDIMLSAIHLAGYNWDEADKFRKAMGKKIPAEMMAQEDKFKAGCVAGGLSQEKTDALWELIKPFAAYGFNKAHAASYGIVAYLTAYLKANFPTEYMTMVLSMESDDAEKVAAAVQEAKKMGIKILPPDINESRLNFTYISDAEIRFGFLAIKNLGADVINVIVAEREKNGPFKSFEDLLKRVQGRTLNKKSLEALAMSGALDSFAERGTIMANMDLILGYIKNSKKETDDRQTSLFATAPKAGEDPGLLPLNLKATAATDIKTKLQWEKELLGLYVSSHPFAEVATLLTGRVRSLNEIKAINREEKIISAGIISTIKKIFTKTNEPMLFVGLEDLNSGLEIIVFPSVLKKTSELWVEGRPVVVVGKLSYKDDEAKVLVDSAFQIFPETAEEILTTAEKALANGNGYSNKNNNSNSSNNSNSGNGFYAPRYNKPAAPVAYTAVANQVWIKLPKYFNTEIHLQIKAVFLEHPGNHQVMLTVEQTGVLRKIQTSYKIKYSDALKARIEEITGEGSVAVK